MEQGYEEDEVRVQELKRMYNVLFLLSKLNIN